MDTPFFDNNAINKWKPGDLEEMPRFRHFDESGAFSVPDSDRYLLLDLLRQRP